MEGGHKHRQHRGMYESHEGEITGGKQGRRSRYTGCWGHAYYIYTLLSCKEAPDERCNEHTHE